jgi:hypothetical protein
MRKKKKPVTEDVAPLPPEPPEKKRSRGGGCYAPLVLVLIAGIVFVVFASSPDSSSRTQVSQPTPTSVPPSSPVPAFIPGVPTPTQNTAYNISGAGFTCQPGIAAGGAARVMYEAVRMRRSPGYAGKDDRVDSIHYMSTGDIVNVRAGPQLADGLCWWLIEHAGFQGWTADHSREGNLLLSAGP